MAIPVAIFGMGRFGRALAACLDERGGGPARVGGRGASHSASMPLVTQPAEFIRDLQTGTLIVLSVRDDSVAPLAAEFAALPGASALRWVHTSGASGLSVLKPLADAGAETGVFHILQSLPPENAAQRIPGSYAAIAGPDGLQSELRRLANSIGVHAVALEEEQWASYHAAAVLASNALLGLLDTGRAILSQAGLPPDDAEAMLLPLVQGTLNNAREYGLAQALTGPVVRGDTGTIRRHLETLQGPARATYIAVIETVVALAERAGRTPPELLATIRNLINNDTG